ncbi:MAG: CapA family protein [Bacteroidaceae bacterium]|nr:CapA family protein [Bacteroidaceae bacterium]
MLRLTAILIMITAGALAQKADTLTVVFGGDVLFDRGVRKVAETQGYEGLMNGVKSVLQNCDAAVVNLECPLTMRRRTVNKKYIFRADTLAARVLRAAGVTHAAMANNHSMDQGLVGLSDTYNSLRAAGIVPMGYAEHPDSLMCPTIIKRGSASIAVFNAVTVPIENWFALPSPGKPAIFYTSGDSLAAAVARYHTDNSTVPIVVFIHWGFEFRNQTSMQQQMDAAALVRAGASAIVGQHPHVVQPQVMIGDVPVWYSVGNLVFDQKPAECNKAQLVKLRFTADRLIDYQSVAVSIRECYPIIED